MAVIRSAYATRVRDRQIANAHNPTYRKLAGDYNNRKKITLNDSGEWNKLGIKVVACG